MDVIVSVTADDRAIIWRRDKDTISVNHDKLIQASRFHVTVKDGLPSNQKGYELEIDGLKEEDEGEYGCNFYDGDRKHEQLSHVTIVGE